jgi:RNA polymerase sigma-70 factor, ECF subfamily
MQGSMALDKESQIRLLVAQRAMILGFIYSITRDADLTEDIFQGLVVLTSEKTPVIESREHFLSWARTSARYMANNAMRSRARLIPLDESILDLLETNWKSMDRHAGVPLSDALEKCLGALSPSSRKLVQLRYNDGLSGPQISDKLGRKLNSVHVGLSRIYKFLADCIESRAAAPGGGHHA